MQEIADEAQRRGDQRYPAASSERSCEQIADACHRNQTKSLPCQRFGEDAGGGVHCGYFLDVQSSPPDLELSVNCGYSVFSLHYFCYADLTLQQG